MVMITKKVYTHLERTGGGYLTEEIERYEGMGCELISIFVTGPVREGSNTRKESYHAFMAGDLEYDDGEEYVNHHIWRGDPKQETDT